ncbi:MAG: serine/threonine protein, partial [Planctomycetota bacterium]
LVARGLLVARESDLGTRFAMSRTLLDYAAGRLPAAGPEGREAAEERHAGWFARFAATLEGAPALKDARDLARSEIENVFAIQDRLEGRKGRQGLVAVVVASIRSTLIWTGPLQEGEDRFARARQALSPEDLAADVPTAVKLALGHSRLLRAVGKWKEALVIAEEAVRLGRGIPPAGLMSEALWDLAYIAGSFSEHARSDAALAESERIARASDNPLRLVSCLFLKTVRIRALGNAAGALAVAEEALALARKYPEREDAIAEALNGVANALSDADDPQRAIRLFREAMEIDERLGHETGLAMRLGNVGDALCDVGDFAAALESFDRAAEIDRRLGRQIYLMFGLIRRSVAVRALGDPAAALALLDEARAQLDRLGSIALRAIWSCHRLETLLSLGDAARAAAEFPDAVRQARADEDVCKAAVAAALGVRALVRLDRAAEAQEVFAREFPAGVPPHLPTLDRFAIFATSALLLERTGAAADAQAAAREAAALAERLLRSHGPRNSVLADLLPDVKRLS